MGVALCYVVFPWLEWASLVLPVVAAILVHAWLTRRKQ